MNGNKKNQNGLTVIELIIIVSVIAIVAVISIPGSTVVLENFRLKTTSSQLSDSLDLALGEAQRRGGTVRVCPSSNARFCRTDGDWNHGWLVFSDGNGDGTVQEIELIKSFSAPSSHVRIFATGAVQKSASLTMSGLVPANEAEQGEFHVCLEGLNPRTKVVRIDESGTVEISRTQSGSGICSRG
ncbi:MAG: GspH/FimT family protein [Xanthomonadales bacterium]|jgi:type IV fimbrial biogenesis protein FimT|nr:GspH/FimT family protein [Xanthomonadales bacterium]